MKFFQNLVQNQKVKPFLYIFLIFIITRLITGYLGYVSFKLIEPLNKGNYVWTYVPNKVLDIWGVWDSGFYLDIADNGYSTIISTVPATLNQANYAFYPLYPLIIRAGIQVGITPLHMAIFVSNLFLLLASIMLFLVVKQEHSEKAAYNSIFFLYAFPTAFILSSVYTESLFLFLSITAFYFINKRSFLIASIFGTLAALTRSVGVLLLIPMVLTILKTKQSYFMKISHFMQSLLIPLGSLIFILYIGNLTGSLKSTFSIQTSWERTLKFPLLYVIDGLHSNLFQHNFTALFVLATVLLFFIIFRNLNRNYIIYSIALFLIPLSTALTSMPRFILIIFPLFIGLGVLEEKHPSLGKLILMVTALLQGFMLVFWTSGFDLLM